MTTIDELLREADRVDDTVQFDRSVHAVCADIATVRGAVVRPRRRRRYVAVGLAAAGASVLAFPVLFQKHPGPTSPYTAVAREVAKKNPRLIIDQPGWKVTSVSGFGGSAGDITYRHDNVEAEFNWRRADQYPDYYEDRAHDLPASPTTVAGRAATIFTYSRTDIAVMLEPKGDSFLEVRMQGEGKDELLDILTHTRFVGVDEWLAALPTWVSTDSGREKVLDDVLKGVKIPPAMTARDVQPTGYNDPYQTGASVYDTVICTWLKDWQDGDADVAAEARSALLEAQSWPFLTTMDEEGAYGEMVRDSIVGGIHKGTSPERMREHFGCK